MARTYWCDHADCLEETDGFGTAHQLAEHQVVAHAAAVPSSGLDSAEEEGSVCQNDSGLDLMYRPLPTKVIWMLQHKSRCYLAAVDHLRCTWACGAGASNTGWKILS